MSIHVRISFSIRTRIRSSISISSGISISISIHILFSISMQRPQKLMHSFKILRLGLISAPLPGRLDIKESTQTLSL